LAKYQPSKLKRTLKTFKLYKDEQIIPAAFIPEIAKH
jgi:hypothetical protein